MSADDMEIGMDANNPAEGASEAIPENGPINDQELLRRNTELNQTLQTTFNEIMTEFNNPEAILAMSLRERQALFTRLETANAQVLQQVQTFTTANINSIYNYFSQAENASKAN